MQGFGEHVQLSVFRCDLTPQLLVRLKAALVEIIHQKEDQVLIVKLGPATPKVIHGIEVLGKPQAFEPPSPTVV